ncbi:NADH-quinone oxidoreductase subunit N [Pseudarthrobacter sp. AL07]|uniref:NADH-quinone oxidoreductase subunit N n=1 Tax=unclassified Pseudarthrobacter TaxID=2647000 RepID=UPI00249C2998|nr:MULTISPECIES: NADH-quinone oxidoreductase subunit N [unclassified Pseudarthrobacter]MDI3195241.1 NADH-quinone oxidoreductase subunit N [Pseudarthrobacter sp. AL20]MDI3209307.1 NADH-quinone oxidoreductase subunit N [Pseudarthrobacter sp. AL07]
MNSGADALALLPELFLLAGAVLALLAGSFTARERQWISRVIAVVALSASAVASGVAFAAVASAAGPVAESMSVYDGSYILDGGTAAGRLIVAVSALLVIALGVDELRGTARESETYVLILLASLGAVVLAGASDLLVLAVGFLLASIPLYALIGIGGTKAGAEAALKTYLLGALFGILLLLGVTVLYAVSGTTSYAGLRGALAAAAPAVVGVGLVGVLAGLMFKAGAVPGHFWVPDAAEGSGTAVAAFATTVPKIGGFLAAYRLLEMMPGTVRWPLLIALLSVLTMTLGNLAAYTQTNPRRLLGWSTVSQAGYLLMPVAVAGSIPIALPSLVVFLAGYAVTNLAAFAVIAAYPDRTELRAYEGLAAARPWHAVALVVALLSLVGTPPTAVFLGKLTVFTAAWDGGFWWLTLAAAVNTVISLFYYLRWLAPAFRAASPDSPGAGEFTPRRWAGRTAVAGAVLVLVVGVGAGLAWTALGGLPTG